MEPLGPGSNFRAVAGSYRLLPPLDVGRNLLVRDQVHRPVEADRQHVLVGGDRRVALLVAQPGAVAGESVARSRDAHRPRGAAPAGVGRGRDRPNRAPSSPAATSAPAFPGPPCRSARRAGGTSRSARAAASPQGPTRNRSRDRADRCSLRRSACGRLRAPVPPPSWPSPSNRSACR